MNRSVTSLQFVKREGAAGVAVSSSETSWVPNTDVYLTDRGLVIKVELAGIRSDDLELSVDGSRLRIQGNRPDGCRDPQCKFVLMEINYGAFESVIAIPPGYDAVRARAAYLNGFLRIDVPAAGMELDPFPPIPAAGEES